MPGFGSRRICSVARLLEPFLIGAVLLFALICADESVATRVGHSRIALECLLPVISGVVFLTWRSVAWRSADRRRTVMQSQFDGLRLVVEGLDPGLWPEPLHCVFSQALLGPHPCDSLLLFRLETLVYWKGASVTHIVLNARYERETIQRGIRQLTVNVSVPDDSVLQSARLRHKFAIPFARDYRYTGHSIRPPFVFAAIGSASDATVPSHAGT